MSLHPLDLKLFRDLAKMKGQMFAVAAIMACGLAMMIMARSLVYSLEGTRDAYYDRYRFADVFSDLKRAPNFLRGRLSEIPGVAAVETRVTVRATLDLPGIPEPVDSVIVSLPEDRPQQLNHIFLRLGRFPKVGARGETILGEAFALAHGFRPGDTIDAVIRGRRQRLTVVGIGLSPEYVFEARPGDVLPDNRRFAVFWMNERELSIAADMDGAFNSVLIDLAPGAQAGAVMKDLDRVLNPYGGLGSFVRRDHPSAGRLDDELRILRGLAFVFPTVFLTIAAFMSSAVLTRLVRLQREQIAQIKAFGYSSLEVGVHYLKFAVAIVAIGTILGTIAGFWLGGNVVKVYHSFFKFPILTFKPDYYATLWAFLVSAAAALLGVIGAVRQAVRLPPADAMRPEPPAEFKPSILERLGLSAFASPTFRMALRNIERKPAQAFFTAFGLALATGIPIVPGTLGEGVNRLITFQWDWAQRQDATLSLIEPTSATVLSSFAHLPGVINVEEFRSVPATIRYGHHSRRISVIGISRDSLLSRPLDTAGNSVALPLDGLMLSAKLAELLDVKPGDTVRLEIQEGERPTREAVVQGVVTDFTGLSVYMEIDNLRRLMREGPTSNGAYLTFDPLKRESFLLAVKESPRIAAMIVKEAVRQSFRTTTAKSINMVQGLYFTFSIVVAFGVVYNSARIALSERTRDLATLRVIGFSHREVAGVLISELVLLTMIAVPIGLLIGSGLAALIIRTASTDTIRVPLVFTMASYVKAILIVLISSGISFTLVSQRIRDLDMLSVLKARD